jgi:hypothetical protein
MDMYNLERGGSLLGYMVGRSMEERSSILRSYGYFGSYGKVSSWDGLGRMYWFEGKSMYRSVVDALLSMHKASERRLVVSAIHSIYGLSFPLADLFDGSGMYRVGGMLGEFGDGGDVPGWDFLVGEWMMTLGSSMEDLYRLGR